MMVHLFGDVPVPKQVHGRWGSLKIAVIHQAGSRRAAGRDEARMAGVFLPNAR